MEYRKHVFTHQEKRLFSEILKNYSRVIENKSNHSSALRLKNLTWQRITAEFNSSPVASLHRTSKQLRRLWMNLKQRQKEGMAKNLYSIARGTANEIASDDIQVLANAVISGVDSSMDSDSFAESVIGTVDSELAFSEEPQKSICPKTPLVNEVKIEPVSPINSFPVDTESRNTVKTQPHRLNNTSHSSHQQQNSSNHKESQQALEHHELEILLIKEKIRCQQQEHKIKEERAAAIHKLEHQLLKEKLREARAKADLAELLLRRQQINAYKDE